MALLLVQRHSIGVELAMPRLSNAPAMT